MVDDPGPTRRLFLRNVLLAGVASLVAVGDAEAKTRRHRRHPRGRASQKPHHQTTNSSKVSLQGTPRNVGASGPGGGGGGGSGSAGGGSGSGNGGSGSGSGGSGSGSGGSGSGAGGGGGGGGWSDRRLKRDIRRVGTSPSGLPIYSFQYAWGGPRFEGVMAQDLQQSRPEAIIRDPSGYLKVDYSRIDVEMRQVTYSHGTTPEF